MLLQYSRGVQDIFWGAVLEYARKNAEARKGNLSFLMPALTLMGLILLRIKIQLWFLHFWKQLQDLLNRTSQEFISRFCDYKGKQ